MRFTIRAANALDIAYIGAVVSDRFDDSELGTNDFAERLVRACAMSRQVWLAADRKGAPAALFGAPRRETLIHLLTEAAEIEHNLLCSYLYAAFSLKTRPDGGRNEAEARSVAGWRKTILSVAIEEMGHLALVNNLLVALGGAPQFDRPNLPVPPGFHPAGFVIRLVPFTKATLDHFIYLERPGDAAIPDGAGGYRRRAPLRRVATQAT